MQTPSPTPSPPPSLLSPQPPYSIIELVPDETKINYVGLLAGLIQDTQPWKYYAHFLRYFLIILYNPLYGDILSRQVGLKRRHTS